MHTQILLSFTPTTMAWVILRVVQPIRRRYGGIPMFSGIHRRWAHQKRKTDHSKGKASKYLPKKKFASPNIHPARPTGVGLLYRNDASDFPVDTKESVYSPLENAPLPVWPGHLDRNVHVIELSRPPRPREQIRTEHSHRVPALAHGLEKVVHSQGIWPVQDLHTQRFSLPRHLKSITPPEQINWNAMHPFTPSSKDDTLLSLAHHHHCSLVASTSSTTGALSHCYRLITRAREVCMQGVGGSRALRQFSRRFAPSLSFPTCLMLRRKTNGVVAIDSYSPPNHVPSNQILMQLGHSMEAMLTMDPVAFRDRFLSDTHTPDTTPQAFHYAKIGSMLLRSQQDCRDDRIPRKNKTFDLKTRAVHAIRRDVGNYRKHLHYELNSLTGRSRSYELEYLDMMRTAFMKYSMQARIGSMDGIFVAYHNTSQVFGFEYLVLSELDKRVFGNSIMAEAGFDVSLKLWEQVVHFILNEMAEYDSVQVLMRTPPKLSAMDVFVEGIVHDPGWVDEKDRSSFRAPTVPMKDRDIRRFSVHTNVMLNGQLLPPPHPIMVQHSHDYIDVRAMIRETTYESTHKELCRRKDFMMRRL